MNIASFKIYQYRLGMRYPLSVHGMPFTSREGLIIHLKSLEGKDGFGDIAPLPGFSKETLDEVLDQILVIRPEILNKDIPLSMAKFNGQFENWLHPYGLRPSVQFGLESAIVQLIANTKSVDLNRLFPSSRQQPVRITGLLSGTTDEVCRQAKQLMSLGYSEMKLKVGGDIYEDIHKVKSVNKLIYGKALLHLDANQRWDYDQALHFTKEIGCDAATYIEEPFSDLDRIPDFYDQTLMPIALDETVPALSLDDIRHISGVETIVIKPTIVGGIERTVQMITQAENFALDAVISSSFESSVGIWMLANCAQAAVHNTSAGLDTLKWFHSDVLTDPLNVVHGVFNMNKTPITASNLNFNLLSEVEG